MKIETLIKLLQAFATTLPGCEVQTFQYDADEEYTIDGVTIYESNGQWKVVIR